MKLATSIDAALRRGVLAKSGLAILAALVLTLAACGKKDKTPPAPDPGTASAVIVGSGTASDTATDADAGSAAVAAEEPVDVPTEMDYEELATEEINDKTVEARLKELESQLSSQ